MEPIEERAKLAYTAYAEKLFVDYGHAMLRWEELLKGVQHTWLMAVASTHAITTPIEPESAG